MGRPAKYDIPDRGVELMGAAEVADYLGVHGPTLARWVREGRFPTPLRVLRATPVWALEDVEAFKDRRDDGEPATSGV